MKFCPNCGKDLQQNAKFCPNCGFMMADYTDPAGNAAPFSDPQDPEGVFSQAAPRAQEVHYEDDAAQEEFYAEESEPSSAALPPKTNGYAIASLVLGIAGLFLFFLLFIPSILAIIFGVDSLASYFAGRAQNGFTTVILLQLIIGSMTMIALGIIGYYVARIFDEVRQRPQYILAETTDGEVPAER